MIAFETGKIARFANGSVVISMEDTHVLCTVAAAKSSEPVRDFLPLTVDYQEKQYAQGVIPTTYMRREGAPKERELLCGRIIDRPLRPLFPPGFYHEVQIMVNVLSSDGKQDPDVMAANASSAALMLSDIPWNGPIGVIRVGRIDGKFIVNPTVDELGLSDLNLIYACSRDKTLMIDVQAREITERDLQAGMKLAHSEAVKCIDPQIRLAKRAGKEKKEYKISLISDTSYEKIRTLSEAPIEEVFTNSTCGKFERGEALEKITQSVKAKLEEENDEDSLKFLSKAVDTVRKQVIRNRIIDKGLRVDGRQLDEVRPLHCESSTYPALHGSALFSRGDTQVLCTVTLGAPGDAQRLDSIVGPPTKRFMLHYSFPPFSINEVAKRGGLNRREVGHGTLAEKALLSVLPPESDFPYTVRVNSEVMASDGSTSMASVCGGSMALMDAGIPVREHVAGVSVGLVSQVDPTTGNISNYRILTDILGLEDHLGDMDFKIAGTRKGITAIQLDIKPAGIPLDIICESLEPARKARNQILDCMDQEISTARAMNEGSAPRLATMSFGSDSLMKLLYHRKKIEQETGARVSVNDGTVTIVAKTQTIMDNAIDKIEFLVGREIEVGKTYRGIVSSIKEYGAFVEFNGGQQGLLHISELSHDPVSKVSDVVSVGQILSLTCIGQDVRGNIKLSLKATLPPPRNKKNLESKGTNSLPSQGIIGWAAVENLPSVDADGEPSSSKHDHGTPEEELAFSTPAVVIRSAEDCDSQDIANIPTKKQPKVQKSCPRPYKSTTGRQEAWTATPKKASGNIKLSLKSTLPPPDSKKNLESKGTNSLPSQGITGQVTVENLLDILADGEPSSSKRDDGTPDEASTFSTPTVVIRSAGDCDLQDVANIPTKKQKKVAKSSPIPYKSTTGHQEARTATPKAASIASIPKKSKKVKADDSGSDGLKTSASVVPEQDANNAQDLKYSNAMNFRSGFQEARMATPKKASGASTRKKTKKVKADDSGSGLKTSASVVPEQDANNAQDLKYSSAMNFRSGSQEASTATPKKASGASTPKKTKKVKADDSGSDGLKTSASVVPEQDANNAQDLKYSSAMNFRSGSMKLGDVVTAKVYQVRTYGLVLELSDGARGMHKFEAGGEKDFKVGEELLAKCESFNAKGIPVFSLLD